MILGLIFSIALSYSANTNAATCANGYGIEVKGNSSGTYCRSRRYLNWWSANAWCDAVGMKLVSMEECIAVMNQNVINLLIVQICISHLKMLLFGPQHLLFLKK